MATINFLYRSAKDFAYIQVRLLYRNNEKDIVVSCNTQLKLSKKYWTKYHNQKRIKDFDILNKQTEVKNELLKIEQYIIEAFDLTPLFEINKEWLQNTINNFYIPPISNEEIPKDLIRYFEYYLEYRKHELKKTSIQKFNVIKNKLIELEKLLHSKIMVKEVNDSFKNQFVSFYKQKKYAQNTIQREFSFLKTICRHARFVGLETSQQLDNLTIDKAKVDKIYLDFKELERIENIEVNKLTESLDNARDWLIISCYTGQRVSDFMRFTKDLIREENGKFLIEFTQRKTGKTMTVPLHGKVLEILNKRNGDFPYSISDQRYNEYIKTVCELAGITQMVNGSMQREITPQSKVYRKVHGEYAKCELVTSHIGRRSFATNFYGKIPTTYLIYVTGHSTESMFLNYIGKSNKDLAMELTNYF